MEDICRTNQNRHFSTMYLHDYEQQQKITYKLMICPVNLKTRFQRSSWTTEDICRTDQNRHFRTMYFHDYEQQQKITYKLMIAPVEVLG